MTELILRSIFVAPNSSQKTAQRSKGRKRSARSRRNSTRGSQQPPRALTSIPVSSNPTFSVRRALRRSVIWNSAAGGTLDGLAASTIQVSFAPTATNWRFDGTSIYTDLLPNTSEFSNLFDKWKLRDIMVRIDVPQGFYAGGTAANQVFMPDIFYISDYDDTGFATVTDLLQYPQARRHNFSTNGYSPLILKLSPKPLVDVAGAGVSTTYGPMQVAPWLRTADMSTPHYGLKFAIDSMTAAANVGIPLIFTVWYDLQFSNPK